MFYRCIAYNGKPLSWIIRVYSNQEFTEAKQFPGIYLIFIN